MENGQHVSLDDFRFLPLTLHESEPTMATGSSIRFYTFVATGKKLLAFSDRRSGNSIALSVESHFHDLNGQDSRATKDCQNLGV